MRIKTVLVLRTVWCSSVVTYINEIRIPACLGMRSTCRTQRRRLIPDLMTLLCVPVTGTENNRCDRSFAPGHGEGNDVTILYKKTAAQVICHCQCGQLFRLKQHLL